MKPITQDPLREIVRDFAQAIREKKTQTAKPAHAVINFRDEKSRNYERPVETVPLDLLRYRKDNGRIASDVMNHERLNGLLDENDEDAQNLLLGFLKNKHPERDETLIKSIEHSGQSEPAIITCDGFLINGNRRKMALESLRAQYRARSEFNFMKAVILPGEGDPGGPPTLLEIERLENRYQLQSEGKSEYYNFDRALSIKRKIEIGFSLEDQLRDDPRYGNVGDAEFKKALKQYERDYVVPLACVDRYLEQFDRPGMYGAISAGVSDKEGRWQAFLDYSNQYVTKLANPEWLIECGVDEDEIGAIESAAFKIIRLRSLKGLPKVHQIMRQLPKMCALRESRKHILSIANQVDSALPAGEQFDEAGEALSSSDVDRKWAARNQQMLIMLTKKALDHVENTREKETPVMLLEAAYRKLTHDDFDMANIPIGQYDEANRITRQIQKRAQEIEKSLYEKEKKHRQFVKKK